MSSHTHSIVYKDSSHYKQSSVYNEIMNELNNHWDRRSFVDNPWFGRVGFRNKDIAYNSVSLNKLQSVLTKLDKINTHTPTEESKGNKEEKDIADDDNVDVYINDILHILKILYLCETCECEFDEKSVDTVAIMDEIDVKREKPDNIDNKTWIRMVNLHNTFETYIGFNQKILNQMTKQIHITDELIIQIHSSIMNGIDTSIESNKFRTFEVTYSGSYHRFYNLHKFIKKQIKALLVFVNNKQEEISCYTNRYKQIQDIIHLTAIFMAKFLKIHPFGDGNGRTARFILNLLMKPYCFIPFSVYLKNRDVYLDVLKHAQSTNSYEGLNTLSTYILHCFDNVIGEFDELVGS